MSCGDKIFIVSGKCKLETRTHMGWENLQPPLLWRRDFIVSGMCKLKTRTHMGKTRTHMGWENLQHVLAMAASGRGFTKLIRLLENTVAMAV